MLDVIRYRRLTLSICAHSRTVLMHDKSCVYSSINCMLCKQYYVHLPCGYTVSPHSRRAPYDRLRQRARSITTALTSPNAAEMGRATETTMNVVRSPFETRWRWWQFWRCSSCPARTAAIVSYCTDTHKPHVQPFELCRHVHTPRNDLIGLSFRETTEQTDCIDFESYFAYHRL